MKYLSQTSNLMHEAVASSKLSALESLSALVTKIPRIEYSDEIKVSLCSISKFLSCWLLVEQRDSNPSSVVN